MKKMRCHRKRQNDNEPRADKREHEIPIHIPARIIQADEEEEENV